MHWRERTRVLYYLIKEFNEQFGKELDGRKKVQKLMFLVEHWNPNTNRIVKSTGLTGYIFKIWLYGPFSESLNEDLMRLKNERLIDEKVLIEVPYLSTYIDDGEPRRMYLYRVIRSGDLGLPGQEVREKIREVIKRFGHMKPMELELKVCDMLKLTPLKKISAWGKTIDEYLSS